MSDNTRPHAMNTRLLKDLDARAQQAKDENERLQIRAERAGALARMGRISEAKDELAELRRLNRAFHPTVAAWILLSEGQIEHFSALSMFAQDRFQRAHAIGVGLGDARIQSEGAAWIAMCEYQKGDIPRAFQLANESIANAPKSAHGTLARATLVLADCCNTAGAKELAIQRYSEARDHAVALGDITMQSVILYNRAADSLARLSLCRATGQPDEDDPIHVSLEVASVTNLDIGARIAALQSSIAILHAQLATAQGDWQSGARLYDDCLTTACSEGHQRWMPKFLAERACCLAKLGDPDRARHDIEQSLVSIHSCEDNDDLAIAHGRLSAAFAELGERDLADRHASLARQHFDAFRAEQASLRSQLGLQ